MNILTDRPIDGRDCFLPSILCLLMVTVMGSEVWAQTAGVALSTTRLSLDEGSSGNYTMNLNTRPAGNVTVTVASDNTDVTTNPTALSFTTTDWSTAQTVTVTVGEDNDSLNETATLSHTVSGYGVTSADNVTVGVADNEASGICGRTQQVRAAIVAAVSGITDCADITATHLENIAATLRLDNKSITTLQAGDFAGLTALTQLWLFNNQLGRLPAGVFDELTELTQLYLSSNQLSRLPAGVFDELTALTWLFLRNNQLGSLPARVFNELTALTRLDLNNNQLGSLPAGVFDGLTALRTLQLHNNQLSSLPAGVFDGLAALTGLSLTNNQLSNLPAGVFAELTALTRLDLNNNQLGSLPAGVFAELTALTSLGLSNNQLQTLPAGVFAGLTRLNILWLQGNPVDPMPLPVSIVPTSMSGQVKATIPSGAPFALTLPVTVTNGTTTSSVSIAVGGTESTAFTITRTDVSQPSAVNLGTLPGLPRELHQGYTLVKSGLPLRLFTPGVTVSHADLSLTEGGSNSYTVRLNDLPTGNVTVTIASNNAEATTSPEALTFTNNDWTMAQTVTITAGRDTDSLNDTASISHTISGYRGVTTAPSVRVTVTDDNHGNTRAQATPVTLDTMTTGRLYRGDLDYFRLTITRAATLVAETSGSTDTVGALYDADGTRLTGDDNRGSRGNFQITRVVTAGTYYIGVRGFNASTTGAYTLNVTVPKAVTLSTTRLNLDEGSSDNYTMNLNTQPTGNVTITITSNNAEVTTNPSALTFTNSDWNTAQTVMVTAGEDTDAFNDRAVLSHEVSGYATVMRATNVVVAVADDEASGICGRTQQVRAAIVDRVSGITDCADITATHLGNITGTLRLSGARITTLQAGDFAGLTALTSLSLWINQLSSLPAGVFDELTVLTSLNLSFNQLGSLPAGVFDELTALRELILQNNQLGSLPAGVFDELTALERLWLEDNQLSSLPAGVFDELTALTVLYLDNNQLHSLPAGVFAGLTRLNQLRLQGNPVDPWPLPVSIVPTLVSGQVKATIPSGAPFALTLPVTVTNGTTTNSVSIATGRTESTPFTITRADTSQLSSVDLGTLPGLPNSNHRGYTLVKSGLPLRLFAPGVTVSPTRLNLVEGSSGSYTVRLNDLPTGNVTVMITSNNAEVTTNPSALTFTNSDWATAQTVTVSAGSDADSLNDSAQLSHAVSGYGNVMAAAVVVAVTDDGASGICGRTQQVRAAIVARVSGITDCTNITATHLRNITGTLRLNNTSITTLQAGDFAGLTGLTALFLFNNQLSRLPAGVFDELTALTELSLYNNQLRRLPAGVFDELTVLTTLTLSNNRLSSLPAGVFDELTALTLLWLNNNQLSDLPPGVFDELTALTLLWLNNNQLSRLPTGVFDGLTALAWLQLQGNPVDPLPLPVSIVPTSVTGQVKATIPSGAPFALALPVTVTNGTTTSSVSIATGRTESTPFTITQTDTSQPSAVNLGTLPGLPNGNHRGYTLVKSGLPLRLFAPGVTVSPTRLNLVEGSSGGYTVRLNDLPTGNVTVTIASNNAEVTTSPSALTFTNSDWATAQTVTVSAGSDADSLNGSAQLSHTVSGYGNVMAAAVVVAVADNEASGICGRTQQVRAAIVARVSGITNCANITATHLGNITGTLSLGDKGITTLQAGDFAGLTALTGLELGGNQLGSLPAGVFDELTALTWLHLHYNPLGSLPAGVFDELTALTRLRLDQNSLRSLPPGVFDALTALTELQLNNNPLGSLPDGVFDELTALTRLDLHNNQLGRLPDRVFAGLTRLGTLRLQGNPVDPLPLPVSIVPTSVSGQVKAIIPQRRPVCLDFAGDRDQRHDYGKQGVHCRRQYREYRVYHHPN